MVGRVESGLHVADYILFAAFLAGSLAIGVYHAVSGGRQRTTGEFLLGDRRLQTLPVAISMFASFISGVLILGHPAEVYTRGSQFVMRGFGHVMSGLIVGAIFVPLFFRLNITSVFEYLERRYNSKLVKLIGSVSMLISLTLQMGVVIYAPSVALEAVTGLPLWISVSATATVAIIYTTIGGMKAVIWTDVLQAACMILGMFVMLIQGIIKVGGVSEVWSISSEHGRTEIFDFDVDPTKRATFWSAVFGGGFSSLAMLGIGQMSVQRYCSLPTLRQAKCAVFISAGLLLLVYILANCVGLVIFAHYQQIGCDPLRANYITSANQLVPYFTLDVLNYPGVQGIFLAMLFGGALSTMSSMLNSSSAVTWQDFLQYCFKHLSEARKALVTKLLVVIYGVVGVTVAFFTKYLGRHVIQILLMILGTFYGPLLGVFSMGALFPFANSKGAIVGTVVATGLNIWIVVGNLLVNPHSETLPTTVTMCDNDTTTLIGGNFTSRDFITTSLVHTDPYLPLTTMAANMTSTEPASGPLTWLYSLSFMLYALIGCLVTFIVGLPVSLMTSSSGPGGEVDNRLLIPFFNILCPCLPSSLRRRLPCGVDYDVTDDVSDTCLDCFTQDASWHLSEKKKSPKLKLQKDQKAVTGPEVIQLKDLTDCAA